jgi:hypothetical protein
MYFNFLYTGQSFWPHCMFNQIVFHFSRLKGLQFCSWFRNLPGEKRGLTERAFVCFKCIKKALPINQKSLLYCFIEVNFDLTYLSRKSA